MSQQRQSRVIKRYANRKLYDMSESCYITHDEIATLVKDGEDVKIIDNRTKEDITSLTLTQILFKEEKKQRKTLPLDTLRTILQSGGDFIQKHIKQPVHQLRDDAEETVRKVLAKAGIEDTPGSTTPQQTSVGTQQTVNPESPGDRLKGTDGLREWLENVQRGVEGLQKSLEDRWTLITHSLGQFESDAERVETLENRMDKLENHTNHKHHRHFWSTNVIFVSFFVMFFDHIFLDFRWFWDHFLEFC